MRVEVHMLLRSKKLGMFQGNPNESKPISKFNAAICNGNTVFVYRDYVKKVTSSKFCLNMDA